MDEYERLTIINNDGLLGASRGLLWLAGFVMLISGCGSGYQFGSGAYFASWPEAVQVLLGATVFLTAAFFAIVNFVVANSLANGSKWSWYAGLVISILYLPSCCFPFGALMVVGLVRPSVRKAYGITAS